MAGDDLIDTYVRELTWRLRWRVDGAAVADELHDHLRTACEHGQSAGRSAGDAQRQAIERLGSVDVVAAALLTSAGVRLAVPTRFTRVGGSAALVAAVAWLVVVGAWSASVLVERRKDGFDGAPQLLYVVGAVALWVAAAATGVAVAALCRRHGARRWYRRAAVTCAIAGAAATSFSWFVVAWAGLLAAAGLVVLLSSQQLTVVPRWALVAFAGAWPAAFVAWCVMRWQRVGWRDELGGYPLAHIGAVAVGAVLVSIALSGFGRRLVHESPASI
jgi:hypothetical protein